MSLALVPPHRSIRAAPGSGPRCGVLTPHGLIAESAPEKDRECGLSFRTGHLPGPQGPGHTGDVMCILFFLPKRA